MICTDTMSLKLLPFIAFLVVCTVLPSSIHGETFHVSISTGDDTNPGTSESPFKTITRASKIMNPGDTAVIHEGTYHEQIIGGKSGTEGYPITFQGVDPDRVILTGSVRVNDWIPQGVVWIKTGLKPITPENAFVMVDEKHMLNRAESPVNIPVDSFYLSSSGVYHIRLKNDANPNLDHSVDVYEYDFAFNAGDRWNGTAKSWIILRNLTLEKYGVNGISTDKHNPGANSHWELNNLTVRFNRAEGIFHCLDHWNVHHCRFVRNKGHGCQIDGASVVFEFNYCAENEWFGYNLDAGCGLLIGPDETAHSCIVRYNLFENNGAKNGFGCGIYLEGKSWSNHIIGNKIIGGTAAGIAFYGSKENRVENNVFIDIAGESKLDIAAAFVIGRSMEYDKSGASGNIISNNTVFKCPAPLSIEPGSNVSNGSNNVLSKNLFVSCKSLIPLPRTSMVRFEGNAWYACPLIPDGKTALRRWLAAFSDNPGIILGDGEPPAFRNPDTHDLRLQPQSGLVGIGIDETDVNIPYPRGKTDTNLR